ncbi:MAG: hydroxymethylpyrimidine/phosphomethylpyrimidine kinase [Bacteroidota bacterium]|nr:hydroxymethylpyrimidine/phosphomethylpyrimidine kinase [Bacteroidota bacterium]
MNRPRPTVMTIAGFDPSGCAGLLADIKTFEATGVYGISVCTANTCQNDIEFTSVNWVSSRIIMEQYAVLKKQFCFDSVKIGIIENLDLLSTLIDRLKEDNDRIKIVWDPVLKASAGFSFHNDVDRKLLEEICRKIYLITPNLEEISALFPEKSWQEAASYLSEYCNVLVKGGHDSGAEACDVLFYAGKSRAFTQLRIEGPGKRGTGCVLSASITAHLALGEPLTNACQYAKHYVYGFIRSNNSLIGYHNYMS